MIDSNFTRDDENSSLFFDRRKDRTILSRVLSFICDSRFELEFIKKKTKKKKIIKTRVIKDIERFERKREEKKLIYVRLTHARRMRCKSR